MGRQTHEVIQHIRPAAGKYLEALLGQPRIPLSRVYDSGQVAILEPEDDREIVLRRGGPRGRAQEGDARGSEITGRQVTDEVDEVAPLADQPASAFLRVQTPVTRRHEGGVDAVEKLPWAGDA